jgi:hypothetical protein
MYLPMFTQYCGVNFASMNSPRLLPLCRWLAAAIFFGVLATGASATTVVPPDFSQLVNESDYIIRGVVKSVTSEYRATTSGKGRKIITKVEVQVLEVVAGTPPTTVVLEMLGGTVGNDKMTLEGAPQFKVGDEDILFVSGNGQTICPLVAMMHGRYRVMHEAATGRKYVARSNKVPLQDTAEVVLPMAEGAAAGMQLKLKNPAQALTPEQFIQRVKTAILPGHVPAQQN